MSGSSSSILRMSNTGNNETTKKRNHEVDIQVEIISEENIKPTSPTPDHLRTYEVSFMDQLYPNIYMPFVYFFSNNNHEIDLKISRRQILKQSLSETLTKFYPLAGKVKDSRHIDCNDDGVYYVEAKINHQLSGFLKQPDNKSIHQFLPVDPKSLELLSSKTYVVMIQVTEFDCGGIAIGMYTSHKIIDGYSRITFLKGWAAAARGSSNSEEIIPSFISPSIFPSNPALPENTTLLSLLQSSKQSKSVTKRFLFRSSSIIKLKKKAAAPTRVTAVTGLIWKCVMAASKPKKDISNYWSPVRPCMLLVNVNLRKKSSPPMPNYLIGNIIWNATTTTTQCISDDDDDNNDGLDLDVIVRRIKKAIDEINSDFIEQMKEKEWSLKVGEQLNEMQRSPSNSENVTHMFVTSQCNGGLHELDFGWGNPIWISVGNADADDPLLNNGNLVFLMDTRSGKGIEAWVTLREEVMAVLEKDLELLAFASVNPSPLKTDD